MWLQYVDDTFVKINEYAVDAQSQHNNNIDPHIKFTIELEVNGKLCYVIDDGSTKITIFRKPTHTDQYLTFIFHHPLVHKRSVAHIMLGQHCANKAYYLTMNETVPHLQIVR